MAGQAEDSPLLTEAWKWSRGIAGQAGHGGPWATLSTCPSWAWALEVQLLV